MSMFAYIGPETTVPLLSFLASIAGAILMFGKSIFRFLGKRFSAMAGVSPTDETVTSAGDGSLESHHAQQ